MLFFGDRLTQDGIHQSPGGSGDIDGFIDGGMIRDPHFVDLIHPQPQNLASWHVDTGGPKLLNNEIEVRPIPNYAVKGFGNKRPVDVVQPRSLQGQVKNLIGEFSTGLPALKRFQATEARIFAYHRTSPVPRGTATLETKKVRNSLIKLAQFRRSSTEIASLGEHFGSIRARASNTEITETQFFHGAGVEQVTPIEDNWRVHALSDLQKVDVLKLVPFGRQNERLGILGCFNRGICH